MDPIIILPLALAVAWAATRKKSSKRSSSNGKSGAQDIPPTHDDPFGPLDGPTPEPPRPAPPVPRPPPVAPPPVEPPPPVVEPSPPIEDPLAPFPGPTAGPRDPELGDPSPVDVYPETRLEIVADYDHAAYGLFITTDCDEVYEGDDWYDAVFLPRARELVLHQREAFHSPVAVMYELLVRPGRERNEPGTIVHECLAAWDEFVYGTPTTSGTYSGWIDDVDGYWEHAEWFAAQFPVLSSFIESVRSRLWWESDLAEVFQAYENAYAEDHGALDPTGS